MTCDLNNWRALFLLLRTSNSSRPRPPNVFQSKNPLTTTDFFQLLVQLGERYTSVDSIRLHKLSRCLRYREHNRRVI